MAAADAALIGEVMSDRLVQDGTMQRVRVEQVYVGDLPPEIEVYAPIGSGIVDPCGVLFSGGHPVAMVLTADATGRLSQDACSLLDVATLRAVGGAARPPDSRAVAPATQPPIGTASAGVGAGSLAGWQIASLGALAAVALIACWIRIEQRRGRHAAGPTTPAGSSDEDPR